MDANKELTEKLLLMLESGDVLEEGDDDFVADPTYIFEFENTEVENGLNRLFDNGVEIDGREEVPEIPETKTTERKVKGSSKRKSIKNRKKKSNTAMAKATPSNQFNEDFPRSSSSLSPVPWSRDVVVTHTQENLVQIKSVQGETFKNTNVAYLTDLTPSVYNFLPTNQSPKNSDNVIVANNLPPCSVAVTAPKQNEKSLPLNHGSQSPLVAFNLNNVNFESTTKNSVPSTNYSPVSQPFQIPRSQQMLQQPQCIQRAAPKSFTAGQFNSHCSEGSIVHSGKTRSDIITDKPGRQSASSLQNNNGGTNSMDTTTQPKNTNGVVLQMPHQSFQIPQSQQMLPPQQPSQYIQHPSPTSFTTGQLNSDVSEGSIASRHPTMVLCGETRNDVITEKRVGQSVSSLQNNSDGMDTTIQSNNSNEYSLQTQNIQEDTLGSTSSRSFWTDSIILTVCNTPPTQNSKKSEEELVATSGIPIIAAAMPNENLSSFKDGLEAPAAANLSSTDHLTRTIQNNVPVSNQPTFSHVSSEMSQPQLMQSQPQLMQSEPQQMSSQPQLMPSQQFIPSQDSTQNRNGPFISSVHPAPRQSTDNCPRGFVRRQPMVRRQMPMVKCRGGSMTAGTIGRGRGQGMMNRMQSQQKMIKRTFEPMRVMQTKKKRMDNNADNDEDCQLIGVSVLQKTDDDCQIIDAPSKNITGKTQSVVQQGTVNSKDNATPLSNPITLSVRSSLSQTNLKKPDPKISANEKPSLRFGCQASSNTFNLNSAISITPTPKNNVSSSEKHALASGLPTIDLTQDPAMQNAQTKQASFLPEEINPWGIVSPFKCGLCPAQYLTAASLIKHCQSFHSESAGPPCEMGIPLIDLEQPGMLQKLTNLGIYNFIPLLSSTPGGNFAFPVVSIDSARNSVTCNLNALASSSILTLGPVRSLPEP